MFCCQDFSKKAWSDCNLDFSSHDDKNRVCKIREQACPDCLREYIDKYECNPDKPTEGYACPNCRIPLRTIAAENLAYRGVVSFRKGTERWLNDINELNNLVAQAQSASTAERARLRVSAKELLTSLMERRKLRAEDISKIRDMKHMPWYKLAVREYKSEFEKYEVAKKNFREVWPKRSERPSGGVRPAGGESGERPSGGVRPARGVWQEYDPTLWEQA